MSEICENPEEREAANVELISVGLGRYDGYQEIVVLSYLVDDSGQWFANIMDCDHATKRIVPAELVVPYHAGKGKIPG